MAAATPSSRSGLQRYEAFYYSQEKEGKFFSFFSAYPLPAEAGCKGREFIFDVPNTTAAFFCRLFN
ncbi:hypothetical protein [Hymenobacter sp. AT01-02]|uniref:hypothetical protein n=1 Tax=Hymenobacter sp. AT01-02 TaxID=1571877 RepID=UPI00128EB2BA|nr:hypothetical protein [Hymenobacter sp. AT01-02]